MSKSKSSPQILINPSTLSAADRSFAYGDGAFTTMYAWDGRIALLAEHIQRLQKSCAVLHIAFDDWLCLQNELAKLCKTLGSHAVIKVLISRGVGGRGYQPALQQQPICVISTHLAAPMLENKEIECLGISHITLPQQNYLQGVKHNNRLAQVMAKQEAMEAKIDDMLLCNDDGHPIEACSANIFYHIDGCWYTPPLHSYGVEGIMRNAFIAYLEASNIPVIEATHHRSQFSNISALLLSNAVRGVQSVKRLKIGEKTLVLESDWDALIQPFIHALFQIGSEQQV